MKDRRFLLAVTVLASMVVMSHSVAFAQGTQLFAVLLGGNEVSNAVPPQADVGDQNGFGSATVIIQNSTTICFAILVSRIDRPVAAHIHGGTAGQNGPVLVPLTSPVLGNPGTSSRCVPNLDPVLVQRIRLTPSNYYINVHTEDFPGGALRGQLF